MRAIRLHSWSFILLEKYGLANARLEPYELGKGYVNEYVSVHMMKPQYMPIIAYPATWSALCFSGGIDP